VVEQFFFSKLRNRAHSPCLQVSCGGTHSVALTRDGRMFSVSKIFSSWLPCALQVSFGGQS
jgi:alpha-tubulin suppressor-like RCC1 family protein